MGALQMIKYAIYNLETSKSLFEMDWIKLTAWNQLQEKECMKQAAWNKLHEADRIKWTARNGLHKTKEL